MKQRVALRYDRTLRRAGDTDRDHTKERICEIQGFLGLHKGVDL